MKTKTRVKVGLTTAHGSGGGAGFRVQSRIKAGPTAVEYRP